MLRSLGFEWDKALLPDEWDLIRMGEHLGGGLPRTVRAHCVSSVANVMVVCDALGKAFGAEYVEKVRGVSNQS